MKEETVKPRYELKPYQEETVSFSILNKYSIVALQQGLGKAQPLSSVIYTPSGPKLLEDIGLGDYVIGMDGLKKIVRGIYPQGVKKIFEVTFSDGYCTRCCEDHLWSIKTNWDNYKNKDFRVLPLKNFMYDLNNKHNYKWRIPITQPVQFDKSPLIIPPYTLGVLLGDGGLSHGSVLATNASDHIYNRILEENKDSRVLIKRSEVTKGNTYVIRFTRSSNKGKNIYAQEIQNLGLNTTSYHKRIPYKYMYSSVEDRVALLSGLLDTDGYVSKEGTVQFSSSSRGLVEDITEVIQSLGGITNGINYKKTNIDTDSWYITIRMPTGLDIISKPDKKERLSKDIKYFPKRYVVSVKHIGEEECMCISVDGQHYLTDNYVVTHNTLVAIEVAVKTQSKTLIVCPAYLKFKWASEIRKFTGNKYSISIFDTEKQFYPLWDTDFCIIAYSKVDKAEVLFEWADMVVLDEATYVKSTDTLRGRACHKLIFENSIKRVMLLTGTPILNRVYEFYSLIAITFYNPELPSNLYQEFTEKFPTYVDFANHFSHLREFKVNQMVRGKMIQVKVKQWNGIQNVSELKKLLVGRYIRFTTDEIPNMPSYVDVPVVVAQEDIPELLDMYDSIAEGRSSSVMSDVKAKAALAKTKYTHEYVTSLLEAGESVVVYSDHVESCQRLGELFGVVGIVGTTKMSLRQQMADDFMAGKSKVIVATIGSFSTGIDLIAANNLVFNDFNFVPGNMDQAKYRIRRIGQTKTCFFHYIISSFQDEIILSKIEEKQSVIDQII